MKKIYFVPLTKMKRKLIFKKNEMISCNYEVKCTLEANAFQASYFFQ